MRYFLSHFLPMDGYGYAAIKITEALERVAPDEWRKLDMLRGGKFIAPGKGKHMVGGPAISMTVPPYFADIMFAPHVMDARLYGLTMFEATDLPEGWASYINERVEACIVPCEWCAETFRDTGVTVPIHVALWGIDPQDYYPLDRSDHDGRPYTFLWSGTPDFRKGWDLTYRAFWAAFKGSEDVRMVMHFRKLPRGVKGSNDKNLKLIEGLYDRPELRKMLQAADCYVFPSRGEGWGMPPREAAATGLPVIATNHSGLAEEIADWALPLAVEKMTIADYGFWEKGTVGLWAEPDFDHLVEWMRWCFNNREKAAELGTHAAEWLAENTPWERTARRICEVVQ